MAKRNDIVKSVVEVVFVCMGNEKTYAETVVEVYLYAPRSFPMEKGM